MSSSSLDYLELCRLCLVKDRVQAPIFEEDGDVNQIFLKIHACLPVKVSRDDKLPKKICDDCLYNVNAFYQFWNTTANAEKQLLQWLGEVEGLEDKQGYVTEVLDSNVMKQEHGSDNRLDGSVMQVSGHQNMDINMIENMSIITMPAGSEHQFTTVPIDTGGTVQTVQVSGPSTQTAHDQTGVTHLQEVEVDDDEDNMDDGCDNDDGLPVKEETDEGERSLEQTYVSLPCDEAGPSGLQQQKISEMSEITIQQTADGDPKTGSRKKIPTTTTTITIQNQHHECPVCHKQLKSRHLYEDHMIAHSDARPYQCDICRKSFKRNSDLVVHRRAHTRECNFVCEVCERAFVHSTQLRVHRRRHYNKFTKHCTICQKGFFTNAELRNHMNVRHAAMEFVCQTCRKSFSSNRALKAHAKSHEPDYQPPRRHQCEFCGKTFVHKNSLTLHVRSHTGEIRYVCDVCGKSVTSRSTLKEHMRTHTGQKGYVCEYCGKSFNKRGNFVTHMRVHTGEKPYVCDICAKAFSQNSSLVIHRRSHTGYRPYKCDRCWRAFVSRAALNGHYKVHEKVD